MAGQYMNADRQPRTADVELRLRQASGFGCCRCGFPVIQYHHIILNSVEHHNRPEDMMVLCPICHDMATKGAFTMEEQRNFQRQPHNIQRGYSTGLLRTHQDYPAVQVGSVIIVGNGPIIVIDDEPVLSLEIGEQGQLLLTATLKNEDDEVLALIERNEWIGGSPGTFDLHADYQKLKINYRERGVALRLDARGEPMQMRARLWHNGALVDFRPSNIVWFGQNTITNLGLAGMSLHLHTDTGTTDFGPQSTTVSGGIVSEPDMLQRLLKTRNFYNELVGKGSGKALRAYDEPNVEDGV
jgi:hypothetical protein